MTAHQTCMYSFQYDKETIEAETEEAEQWEKRKDLEMATNHNLPMIDLSSSDRVSTASSIRQACLEYGFFYLVNHGIEDEMIARVFDQSSKFFALPVEEKMKLEHDENHRGYTPLLAETLDTSLELKGDAKESFYIGPFYESEGNLNQWPSEEVLPFWRKTMECFHEKLLAVGRKLISLVALALNFDEYFFERIGGLHNPVAFLRLLRYPGDFASFHDGVYGASAHSDYGMITLLATDGIPGLQICREKDKMPQLWEDVPHVAGSFIVNVGDMLERWTNCLFRSTLHRVQLMGQERYSVAFFLDPNADCIIECLESCCSETRPPRFPPIRSGDYLLQRLKATYDRK